jgi:hypothetical protein
VARGERQKDLTERTQSWSTEGTEKKMVSNLVGVQVLVATLSWAFLDESSISPAIMNADVSFGTAITGGSLRVRKIQY